MMEIKFRARRIDNGRWVYGQYFKTPLTDENSGTTPDAGWFFLSGESRHCIVQDSVSFVVDVKTLGQYTGLKDRNCKEIYEGDILDHYATVGYVIFEDGMFTLNSSAKVNFGHRQPLCYLDTTQCEVIGNTYENPDLAVNEG